jgi:hypothetical protein
VEGYKSFGDKGTMYEDSTSLNSQVFAHQPTHPIGSCVYLLAQTGFLSLGRNYQEVCKTDSLLWGQKLSKKPAKTKTKKVKISPFFFAWVGYHVAMSVS